MQLNIPYFNFADNDLSIEEVSANLDTLEKLPIANTPWADYIDKPDVKFVIAHSGDAILLKYWVVEKTILAIHRSTNEPVYKDTCVEFFVALNNDLEYYNFEFNCAGTCLAAFGPDRHSRELLPVPLIENIKVKSIIRSSQDGFIHWELSLKIPINVFNRHNLSSLNGLQCSANFYKCGDDLPEPHFLTWNNIVSEIPNFHLSEFFAKGQFASVSEPKLKETLNF